ncbi:hypothetical protein EDD18DRAFT_1159019 [Armillaria luteobubalina]|uniref:Uncharacterized protein n=1 Tax=Armillaria luteobubalina TaxID=153913 RepID=A0AA39Q9N8_9AGAR|nr:hypothetical protein EDD18DRAFT_1159019 [Armillaria luteobubalina]
MAVNLTLILPSFSTPQEHLAIVSCTPQNFADIPPVLCHPQEDQVRFEAPLEGNADRRHAGTLCGFVEDDENAEGG